MTTIASWSEQEPENEQKAYYDLMPVLEARDRLNRIFQEQERDIYYKCKSCGIWTNITPCPGCGN